MPLMAKLKIQIKYNEKYSFKNINFEFSYNKKRTFNKSKLNFKKIKFFSEEIYISLLAPMEQY